MVRELRVLFISGLSIVGDQLELASEYSALIIDVFNGEFSGILHRLPIDIDRTGLVKDTADDNSALFSAAASSTATTAAGSSK